MNEDLKEVLLLLKKEVEDMLKKIESGDRSYFRAGVKGAGIEKRIKEAEVMIELAKTIKKILERGVLA